MRTYANREQVIRLAWKLFESQVQGAKEFLEPKGYKVNGINYEYRRVQAALDTLYAINDAVKKGTVRATKSRGLHVPKKNKTSEAKK